MLLDFTESNEKHYSLCAFSKILIVSLSVGLLYTVVNTSLCNISLKQCFSYHGDVEKEKPCSYLGFVDVAVMY